MDVLEMLYPSSQLVLELDHIAGHEKCNDKLRMSNMDVKHEGKQRMLRDSIMI